MMNKERDSFIFHKNYVKALPESKKEKFCYITVMYELFGQEPSFDDEMEAAWWDSIKERVDADHKKWEETKQKRSEAGKKHSGNQYTKKDVPTKNNEMEDKETDSNTMEQSESNGSVIVSDIVSVSDTESVYESEFDSERVSVSVSVPNSGQKAPSRTRFVKPTYEEVRDYCAQRGNSISPERFVDYYESKGWLVGKNPMKDWKASVRTWESKESDFKSSNGNTWPDGHLEL